MNRRRGLALPTRGALLACAVALCLASVSGPVAAAPGPSRTTTASPSMVTPVVPPRVAGALLRRPGTVLRRDGGFVVERVRVPRGLRSSGVPRSMLRVTRPGRYAPRALPYVLTVDGVGVASAIPSPTLRSVVALTDEEAVVTAELGLTYGGRPAVTSPAAAVVAPSIRRPRRLPSPGPYDVARREYDLGDRAFQPTGLGAGVEIRADVHFPAGLADGPYPIVLFMHGNHSSCYRGQRAGYRWPCREGWKPIPNHEGYDYAASRLASYGYVVVSVSANGVNVLGSRLVDTGMRQRGELLEEHLDLWQAWSTTGGEPFADAVRRQGRHDHDRHHGPLPGGRRGRVARDRGSRTRRPLRHRCRHAARTRRLHARDREPGAARGGAALLRRRRVRSAGRALLRRRSVPSGGRSEAQAHAHALRGEPQLLQHRVDDGVPGRLRRHLQPMRGQAHPAGTAPGRGRLHHVVLPPVPGRGERSRPDLDRRRDPRGYRPHQGAHGLPRAGRARSPSRRGPVHRRAIHQAHRGGRRRHGHGVVAARVVRQQRRGAVRAGRPVVQRRAPARALAGGVRLERPRRRGAVRTRGRGRRDGVRRRAVPRDREPRVPRERGHVVPGPVALARRRHRRRSRGGGRRRGQRGAPVPLGRSPVLGPRHPAAGALPARGVRRPRPH